MVSTYILYFYFIPIFILVHVIFKSDFLKMEMLRRLSLRNAGIEIVKRTITEEYPDKGHANQWNNNDAKNTGDALLGGTDNVEHNNIINGHLKGDLGIESPNNDDFVVIELVDEVEQDIISLDDKYVDIDMQSSKQILLYPTKKRRLFNKYRARAVSHAVALRKFHTYHTVLYLRPFFRLTISPTQSWYVTHHSSVFIKQTKKGPQRKPIHYTERVELRDGPDDDRFLGKKPDSSGIQLIFSDETSDEVSKLTLSSDFTSSCEEKHLKLKEVSRSIELSEENDNRGTLKRSYSIEFLNEERNGDVSFSAEDVAKRIADDDVRHIYDDSVEEPSERSFDSTYETPTLKRSFSIEFLNEDEDRPLSSEVVHYKMERGEGVLVYSEVETMNDFEVASSSEEQESMKRSFSIEFLNDLDDKRSEFSCETVSNKIEKGEGRLIYDDTSEVQNHHNASWNKRSGEKLKTLGIEMDTEDKDEMPSVSFDSQQKAYNIELLKETDDGDDAENDVNEEIVPAHVVAEESTMGDDFLARFEDSFDSRNDDPNLEKRRFNLEILEEKPDLNLQLNETSTPLKKPLRSPKKSPLQTVHIGVEFEKRNKSENDETELFVNDAEEYLVYEGKTGDEGGANGVRLHHKIPNFKLETIVINMDTHHKQKRSSLLQHKRFQLEFQSERERRASQLAEYGKDRLPSDSSVSLRTVSIENDAEEVIHDENELKPPELLKRKAYSVEYLNEMEGDRSVFYEEFVDEGEPRWSLEI